MFESKRELKRQIVTLTERLGVATYRADEQAKLASRKTQEAKKVTQQRDKALERLAKSEKDRKELAGKLRDQSKADLLLNALEAVGIIKDESPSQSDREAAAREIMDRQRFAMEQLRDVYPRQSRYLGQYPPWYRIGLGGIGGL